MQLAGQFHAHAFRQAHPRRAAEHHALGFQATDADGDHTQGVYVRRMAVGADTGIREGHAVTHLNHRGHFLQIDLVHDAVARRDHIDVLEGLFGPLDEVETVFVATVFNGAVFFEGLRIKTTGLDGQGVVDDQLGGHYRVDLRRVAALLGDGIAQAGEVDKSGLAEDVMAHHAGREPREVEVALALDQLAQGRVEGGRVATAHQVLGEHARSVGQRGVGAGGDCLDSRTGVEEIQAAAGERFAKFSVHRQDSVTVSSKGELSTLALFPVGAGLPAMASLWCDRYTEVMPSQASQLPHTST
ncbi:hypothetical protein ALP43_01621 [Pseudomonas azotoformans]|nr:hypothetical protein ALP43_01621 [Pseudomonas azotoformans]